MATLICDFMSDSYLESIAENLCTLRPKQFSHLLAHRRPDKNKKIDELIFLDATQLYRHENLSKCFKDLAIAPIELTYSDKLAECQILFMAAFDRTAPEPNSTHYVQHLFWDLVGYYISFFRNNINVDSVLFDNTPHLPWDICLFFVAKMLDKKVLFLRKTGMCGYLYIDEDFRPNKGAWKSEYTGLLNPLKTIVEKEDFFSDLNDLSFSKGQVDGMWPKKLEVKKDFLLKIKDSLRSFGLGKLVSFIGVLLKSPLNNHILATQSSSQRTVLAGMVFVSRWRFVKLHFDHIKALKAKVLLYSALSSKSIDLSKPYVYFALHLQPERTTLPEGLIYDDQVIAIRTLSEALPIGWKIFVKEHPRQMKYDIRSTHGRSCLDYERLSAIDNVLIAPLDFSHEKLVASCKCTSTISGSVSWEGLLLGKPSLVFSENWHADCDVTYVVASVKDAKDAFLDLANMSANSIKLSTCRFVLHSHKYLINSALNGNHLRVFFDEKTASVALNNISSGILQRLAKKI